MTPDELLAGPAAEADIDAFLAAAIRDYNDDIHRDAVREGLAAVMPAICRRAIAAKLTQIAACYPADVFPPDGTSRDAVSGTALRVVLSAQAALYRGEEQP